MWNVKLGRQCIDPKLTNPPVPFLLRHPNVLNVKAWLGAFNQPGEYPSRSLLRDWEIIWSSNWYTKQYATWYVSRTPTERDGGCMHMICTNSRCGLHWCWVCQQEWTRDCMASHWFGWPDLLLLSDMFIVYPDISNIITSKLSFYFSKSCC